MVEDIFVNGFPVVLSVSHVTEPGEGWQATKFIAECKSMDDLSNILNDQSKQPEMYWRWEIEFQDKEELV